jgi:hypothetical protein
MSGDDSDASAPSEEVTRSTKGHLGFETRLAWYPVVVLEIPDRYMYENVWRNVKIFFISLAKAQGGGRGADGREARV